MFQGLVRALREAGVPVSAREYLTFLEALAAGVCPQTPEGLHALGRAALVKDERLLDRYDQVFAAYFAHAQAALPELTPDVPQEWLEGATRRLLDEAERARLQGLGSLEALLAALRERLAQQRGRHAGGSKWIGTGGTSPFGHSGWHPEGVRIGGAGGARRAVKAWDERTYADLDPDRALGVRSFAQALRALRRMAREEGTPELDLPDTIRATAHRAGLVDVRTRPPRENRVEVVLLLDTGGSMDVHAALSEQLFAAARGSFRRLTHYYFHNCPYEHLWRESARRHATRVPTASLARRHSPRARLIFVGDASMGAYELTHPGGSIEHMNPEPGARWIARLVRAFPHAAWLNPEPEEYWERSASIRLVRELLGARMYALSVAGIGAAVRALRRPLAGAAALP
jgi:uncharacterized protein